jgi:LPXTG-site transpeptidase (sortase) family protein
MSKKFKIVLAIRFLGYAIFLSGLIGFSVIFGPVFQAEFSYRKDQLGHIKRVVPDINPESTASGSLTFANLEGEGEVLAPVSTKFGIVIPKINANAEVIAEVNPASEREYTSALTKGVAHAKGTALPGEKGNIYLFSHSTDAPWNVARYNAVFYLLRELEAGDEIVMFFNDRRYNYQVYDKRVVESNDVTYLTNIYDQSVLTLQTCDPPGTVLRRLIVRARLKGA